MSRPPSASSRVSGKLIDFAHSVRCSRNSLKVNGAGAGNRTRMSVGSGDFKYSREGRRINVYLIRCPFPFTRVTRGALQSEEYGHPGGHLSSPTRPELRRNSTNEPPDKPGAVHPNPITNVDAIHSGGTSDQQILVPVNRIGEPLTAAPLS